MAENSLQNQKNEVSFVLSDNTKAIIEKFENQIEDRSENDKIELRIDLLMLLLRRLHPEVLSTNAKGVYANLYRLNNRTLDKNTGFLMSLFLENEWNIIGEEFKSIWRYYVSKVPVTGIASNNEYPELLLCLDLMPDKKRSIILDYSLVSLFRYFKNETEKEIIIDKKDDVFAELADNLNTIFSGCDKAFDIFFVSDNDTSISISNLNSFVEFVDNNISDKGTVFVMGNPTKINKDDYLQFRKWAVDNKFLHGVIEIPKLKVYDYRNQVLVLKKQQSDSIFFAKVNGFQIEEKLDVEKIVKVMAEKNPDYYIEVSFEEFVSHNSRFYTFAGRQFAQHIVPMPKEGEVVVELRDLVDLYESEVQEDVHCFFLNRRFYIDDGSNYLEGVVMPYARRVPYDEFFLFKWDEDSESFLCSRLNPEKLEFDYSFSAGVRYEYDSEMNPIICTYPDAIIFKIKENPFVPIDPWYLKSMLNVSGGFKEVLSQLEYYKLPYSDVSIEEDDFLSIKVAIPSLEQQLQIMNPVQLQNFVDAKVEIRKNYEAYKQDIRMKKHALAQRLTIMNNWWKTLLMARKDGNGIIDDEAVVGRLHPVAVKSIYAQIGHEMNMLFKQLNSFNLGDAMDNKEIFDATAFVQEYVIHHDPMFEYQCELPDKPANIRFPQEAFQIILDNISSNACSHGFKGREKEKNIIRIIAEIKGQDLIIRVDNNGWPMPVGMTSEKVFTYGDTTEEGSVEHGGLGGYQIKDLMKRFGGEVELELNAEAEFPVTYKLVFRDVNIYK